MEEDFHGRPIGALSVTGFEKSRALFPQNSSQGTRFLRRGDLEAFDSLDPEEIAGVILEPRRWAGRTKASSPSCFRAVGQ